MPRVGPQKGTNVSTVDYNSEKNEYYDAEERAIGQSGNLAITVRGNRTTGCTDGFKEGKGRRSRGMAAPFTGRKSVNKKRQ